MSRSPKEIAVQMLQDSPERKEAEKMMGKDFSEMEPEERVTAATVLSAFDGQWQEKPEEGPYCGSSDGHEIEYCNVCEREIELRWDINQDGFQAYCPVCGSRLMLCDACTHRFGEAISDCDYQLCEKTGTCRFSRPKNWWKENQE